MNTEATRNSSRRSPIALIAFLVLALASGTALTAGGHGGGGGGGFGGGHMGGGVGGFSRGFAGHPLAGTRDHFGHGRRFGHDRRFRFGFGSDDFGVYDNGCGYGYPYYNPYSCYPTY